MSTTVSNPVSFTNSNPSSVVSGLENALMNSIGQGMQSGQTTQSAGLQQEMQLLTELLNQSNNSGSTPSPTSSSDPSTSSSDPSASSAPSTSSAPPSTSAAPPTSSSSSTSNNGVDKMERKLDRALERNITDGLQNGQTPSNGNALEQEMNLLIQLLGQGS